MARRKFAGATTRGGGGSRRRGGARRKYKPAGKLGSGKRFAAVTRSVARRGKVRNPKAVAAVIGRAKYGKRRMAKMAAAGRKRKARARRR